jgi:hypothetical protein
MSGTALQFWPRMRRVERAAWSAIMRCVRARKLESVPLPVPVEQWIEGPLGIRFGIADLSHLGPQAIGRSRPKDREIEVSVTIVKDEPRFRFTAAHELGHVVLHAKVTEEFREDEHRDFYDKAIEREADRFAAAFLMPIPSLGVELAAASSEAGLDVHDLLRGVRGGDAPHRLAFRGKVLPALARKFGVSLTAAAHRFSDIELATGEVAIPFEAVVSVLSNDQAREVVNRR